MGFNSAFKGLNYTNVFVNQLIKDYPFSYITIYKRNAERYI